MHRPAPRSKSTKTAAATPVKARPRVPAWLVAVLLAIITLALYWPATGHDFVGYDDNEYVVDNPHVSSGLAWENLRWAFQSSYAANWHPVTWLSHMLDCQIFGLKPWGHHLTSVLLHTLNSVLVFALLRQLTGTKWRSLLVAALFALHPLRVESVAWVAERKDVLSGCFFLLTLLAYARYAQVRGPQSTVHIPGSEASPSRTAHHASRFTFHASLFYVLSLLFFALGLMSKPMLVTLPFVLLLLDIWPLGRMQNEEGRMKNAEPGKTPHAPLRPFQRTRLFIIPHSSFLILEKVPFFVLAAAMSAVTLVAQKQAGAVAAVESLSFAARSGNALVSYCRYLGKLCWPTHLAVFYPYTRQWSLETVLWAGGVILGTSALLFVARRRYPFLLTGWLWFCGTLVPVIGLVQVGRQAMADRYSYIPSLGMLVLAVWGAYELAQRRRYGVVALSVAGSTAILLCMGLTRQQLGYWKDREALFRHALEVTEDNYVAHHSLGTALYKKGQIGEAISQYEEAIRLQPDYAEPYNSLGTVLFSRGRIDEAISRYQQAVRLRPNSAVFHYNLGNALYMKGQTDAAISEFEKSLALRPDHAGTHHNLGLALSRQGRTAEAISQWRQALRLKPDLVDARYSLACALARVGQLEEAINEFKETLRLRPGFTEAHQKLDALLAARATSPQPRGVSSAPVSPAAPKTAE